MPKLRLIKDDPSLRDIIPFPTNPGASHAGSMMGPALGGRLGARLGRPPAHPAPHNTQPTDHQSASDLENELLGTIDRMKAQLDELSDMIGPFPLYPEDDRPTAA